MAVNHFPMRTARALVAADPLRFGRAAPPQFGTSNEQSWTIADDLRLFAATFVAGFLFVTILVA